MTFSRSRLFLVALVAPIAMVAATTAPASAATAATAVVTGSGSISPGLGLVPTAQTFSFSGTATVTGVLCGTTYVAETVGISASGTDLAGSVAQGEGLVSVTIGGCSGDGVFTRVGAKVDVALVLPVATVATGECVFVPGQLTPPVTTYSVTCGATIVSSQ